MTFDFETSVDRGGIGNMKGAMARDPAEILNLSGAEMDFATAPVIRQALAAFSRRGLYGFTLPDPPYLDAVCRWMRDVRNAAVTPDMVVPTLGTISGLCTALRAFTAPGDGVIIQHPSYYRFDRAILRNGRRVVSNPMTEREGVYSLDFQDLEEKMSRPENRLLILCNPHNPTGKVFSPEDLERIAGLAARYGTVVFSDEIFAETAAPEHPARLYADVDPIHAITSTSLGKAFNLTGVNHANLIIPEPGLRSQYRAQQEVDHYGSVDPFFYTALRAAYSPDGAAWLRAMNEHTRRNYERIRQTLSRELPMLRVSPLEGTFVVWMDLRALGLTDEALEQFLLDRVGVLADLGWEYGPGGTGFVRLNIATPTDRIEKFLTNLTAACRELCPAAAGRTSGGASCTITF